MPIIRISNVDVDFPKDPPYPCQVEYMNQCIKAISSGANALLESPTGTGKTLCLYGNFTANFTLILLTMYFSIILLDCAPHWLGSISSNSQL